MLPWIMHLRFVNQRGKGIGLWLPIFLAWPILIALLIILLPLVCIAEIVLRICHVDLRLVSIIIGLLWLCAEMRGMRVVVNSRQHQSNIHITIH
jgi:hypothetical protein